MDKPGPAKKRKTIDSFFVRSSSDDQSPSTSGTSFRVVDASETEMQTSPGVYSSNEESESLELPGLSCATACIEYCANHLVPNQPKHKVFPKVSESNYQSRSFQQSWFTK